VITDTGFTQPQAPPFPIPCKSDARPRVYRTTDATWEIAVLHQLDVKPALKPETRDAILLAIAKARSWIEDLASGRIQSVAEIAEREGKVERHIRLLAPLAFTPPQSLAAISQEPDRPISLSPRSAVRSLGHGRKCRPALHAGLGEFRWRSLWGDPSRITSVRAPGGDHTMKNITTAPELHCKHAGSARAAACNAGALSNSIHF
jgi:hypothetical protein